MSSRRLQLGSLLLPLLLVMPAWTQSAHYAVPAASVEDQFSAYDQALSGAAERLLAATVHLAPGTTSPQSAVNTPRPDDARLRRFAQRYWNGQDENVRSALERVRQLRPTLDPILHEEGIPVDVAALVLVESGGRPTALSPKGALGLWQFMPETARRYGLAVEPGRDERLDIVKSTRAAARYLRDLYSQFGDWNLAFAAYNTGEQAVQRAIGHNRARDFDSLSRGRRLPLETRNYVPAVLSAMRLLGGILPAGGGSLHRSRDVRVLYADVALNN